MEHWHDWCQQNDVLKFRMLVLVKKVSICLICPKNIINIFVELALKIVFRFFFFFLVIILKI